MPTKTKIYKITTLRFDNTWYIFVEVGINQVQGQRQLP